jgi:hypothetical protein
MSQKIFCIFTAKGCHHCEIMRRFDDNGNLLSETDDSLKASVPGGEKWSREFMSKLTNDYTVVNIHYKNVGGGSNGNIAEVLYFGSDSSVKRSEDVSTIPKDIGHYVVMYPSFGIFDSDSWKANVKGDDPLIGEILGVKVIQNSDTNGKIYNGVNRDIPITGRLPMKVTEWAHKRFGETIPIPEPPFNTRSVPPGIEKKEITHILRHREEQKELGLRRPSSPYKIISVEE